MGVSANWGTLLWGPYNKDPTIEGTILGCPIFGNSHITTGFFQRFHKGSAILQERLTGFCSVYDRALIIRLACIGSQF